MHDVNKLILIMSFTIYVSMHFNFTGNKNPYIIESGNKLLVCTIFGGKHMYFRQLLNFFFLNTKLHTELCFQRGSGL